MLNWLSSAQLSHSVMPNSLWTHELQHARPPCPSPTPGVYSNSRPSSQWCHPAISSSVVPFFSCPQCLLASESFPMSQLFTWGGQSTGVSALASLGEKNPKKHNILAHEINISVSINKISLELRNTHLFRRCRRLFSHYNGRLVMENSLNFLLFDPSQKLAPKGATRLWVTLKPMEL